MKKKIFGILIALIIFFFLGRYLYIHWEKLSQYQWDINIWYFVAAFLVLLIRYTITIGIWKKLLSKLGGRLSYKKCVEVWFISLMGKYIPGKVWSSIGRIYLAKEEGVSVKATLSSLVYEYVLAGISSFAFGISLVLIYMGKEHVEAFIPLLYLIPLLLFLLHPKIFETIANFILEKMNRESISISLSYLDMLKFLSFYLFNWLVMSAVIYFFVNAIYPIKIEIFPPVAGIFALSMLAGFISLFTPAGLGVREGILSGLLAVYMPLEIAIVIALAWRLAQTIVELSIAGTISLIKAKRISSRMIKESI